jgi:NAD(P)-dependent dehydrogenase (short-subunit alcohol dehydrogenase family)
MNIFENRVAIVTGSSKGIGRHLALELAKKGAKVVLNGRNAEAVETTQKWLAEQGFTDTLTIANASSIQPCNITAASTCFSTTPASDKTKPPWRKAVRKV